MSFGYQTGALSSPGPGSPSGYESDSGAGGGVTQTFSEPERDLPEGAPEVEEGVQASAWYSQWSIPKPLLRMGFRVRNSLAVYSFLLLFVNAYLNVEIYREYISSAIRKTAEHAHDPSLPSLPSIQEHLSKQAMLQNLYIATLLGPLCDLLSRIAARNFFKLCLAKSMSHSGFAASLAQCSPSLNAYTLLILKGRGLFVPFIVALQAGEIVYSIRMWQLRRSQQHTSIAMYTKLLFIAVTAALCAFDICYLFYIRRFILRKLPRHIHPVYVVWDANRHFHWSAPNSMPDLLLAHEDLQSEKFTSEESKEVRKQIARWNKGEEELEHFGEDDTDKRQRQRRNNEEEGEDSDLEEDRQQAASALINGRHGSHAHNGRR